MKLQTSISYDETSRHMLRIMCEYDTMISHVFEKTENRMRALRRFGEHFGDDEGLYTAL
jgi:hypothetical protein